MSLEEAYFKAELDIKVDTALAHLETIAIALVKIAESIERLENDSIRI